MGDTRKERKAPRSRAQQIGDGFNAAGGEESPISNSARLLTSLRTLAGALVFITVLVLLVTPATRAWVCMRIPVTLRVLGICDSSYPINAYLTDDPSVPPDRLSEDWSLLGIEEGTTVKDVDAMFPPSASHKTAPGTNTSEQPMSTHTESWTWRGITVDVVFDDASAGAINIAARRENSDGDYASLPRGLLLGQATVADAIEAFDYRVSGYAEELDAFYYSVALAYEGEESASAQIVADRPNGDDYGDPDWPLRAGDMACEHVVRFFRLREEEPVGWGGEGELGDCSLHLFDHQRFGSGD